MIASLPLGHAILMALGVVEQQIFVGVQGNSICHSYTHDNVLRPRPPEHFDVNSIIVVFLHGYILSTSFIVPGMALALLSTRAQGVSMLVLNFSEPIGLCGILGADGQL